MTLSPIEVFFFKLLLGAVIIFAGLLVEEWLDE